MNIEDLLREAGRDAREQKISPEVEKHLVHAFQQKRRNRRFSLMAVAATVVLCAVGTWSLFSRVTSNPSPVAQMEMDQVDEVPTPILEAGPEEVQVQQKVVVPVLKRKSSKRSVQPVMQREIRTAFYALEAGVLSENIEGYLVRVQVPRATMMSFGLPVQYEPGESGVDADLLIGEDGAARAIRFVRVVQ